MGNETGEAAEGATKRCPFCAEEIQAAAILCKHCHSALPVAKAAEAASNGKSETVGAVALALPLLAMGLTWLWVLTEAKGDLIGTLATVSMAMAIGTALLIGLDARSAGAGGPKDEDPYAASPLVWFFGTCLFWIVSYPTWLFHRRTYGLKSRGVAALAVVVLFLGNQLFVGAYYGSSKVSISCSRSTGPAICSVTHVQGLHLLKPCWDYVERCANGRTNSARACSAVAPGNTVTEYIQARDLRGLIACDEVVGVPRIENIDLGAGP